MPHKISICVFLFKTPGKSRTPEKSVRRQILYGRFPEKKICRLAVRCSRFFVPRRDSFQRNEPGIQEQGLPFGKRVISQSGIFFQKIPFQIFPAPEKYFLSRIKPFHALLERESSAEKFGNMPREMEGIKPVCFRVFEKDNIHK